jgi:hypothetical protein
VRTALFAALLVACTSSDSTMLGTDGDGITADGTVDADVNGRGTVTVRIVDKNAAPLSGMYVAFSDTDGTVTERTTDAAGNAQADVYLGASVTAVRVRGASYALATVQALAPGDVITLISAASAVNSSEDPFSSRVVPLPGADIVASPNGASKQGSTATFTTVAPHGLVAGDRVIVSKVGVAGYNGTWTVASVPTPTKFTANIGSGSLANSGSIATGGATAMKAVPFTVSYAAYGGAGQYEVRSRCGTANVGTSTSPQLALPVGCVASTLDFEVLAKSSTGATLAWTQKAGVAVTSGGSTTITDTWHPLAQLTATYTNPTALVTSISAARFSPYVRGLPVAEASATASATTMIALTVSNPPSGALATQLTCPMGSGPSCLSTSSGAASQRITELVDGTATSYALDIGANLLPWVKATYVPSTTTLDVLVTGTGSYDLFEANLRYTRGQTIYTWRLFGPTAGPVRFPTLPATAPGNPTIVPSDIMSSYQVFVGDSDAVDGYRDAIDNVFEALGTCEASSNTAIRPYPGAKNRISQWN